MLREGENGPGPLLTHGNLHWSAGLTRMREYEVLWGNESPLAAGLKTEVMSITKNYL